MQAVEVADATRARKRSNRIRLDGAIVVPPGLARVTRAREIAALALAVAAAATALPQAGWNAAAHFSLVEALADGTPRIDEHLNQGGDIAYVDGHFYAAKSPGLAVFSLPLYLVLHAADEFPPKQPASSGPPARRPCPSGRSGGSTGLC